MSTRVIGYCRVSTDEQFASGAGLSAQQAAIKAECEQKGWELLEIIGEPAGASSKTLEREGLQRALQALDKGQADVLVVSKLDRLSREIEHGIQVMNRAKRKGWSLRVLDFDIDTTTPSGEFMANIDLSRAQYERRLIGVRTRDALKIKKQQGVRLGTPPRPDEVILRILRDRESGMSFRAIAEQLSAEGVATARGGAWQHTTVRAVCNSEAAARLAS